MPTLNEIRPGSALPGGEIHLSGSDLGPDLSAEIAGVPALVTLARPTRATLRVPEGVLPGDLIVTRGGVPSNPLPVHIAVPMAENLHPVANPAVDRFGNVYATLSGSRGQATPVSIFRIAPAPEGVVHELRPFVREILNPTGLAFGPDGDLYVSSRAEGTVYRVDSSGHATTFAEGLGIATGIAFDAAGDLYVGDRSGTIFKIRTARKPSDLAPTRLPLGDSPETHLREAHLQENRLQETFVFATLEPSIAAYHLAFDSRGTLYVTGPTTASNQSIHAIAPDGTASVFFHGLGRAQGLAFDTNDNLYVAASLHGERGIVRITPARDASLVLAGSNLVGLCLLPNGQAALATRDTIYEVTLTSNQVSTA